jgi:hypothetical protein
MTMIPTLNRRTFIGAVAAGVIAAPLAVPLVVHAQSSSNATVVPQLQAAVNALVQGQVTQTQIDNIRALANQLLADAVVGDDPTFVTSGDGGNNVARGGYSAAGGAGSETGPGANGAFAWGEGAQAFGGGSIAFGRSAKSMYTDTFVVGQGCEAYADNGRSVGWRCLSTAAQGFAHGYQADDRGIDGLEAYAHGNFGTGTEDLGGGSAQTSRVVLRAQTNDATPTPLTTDGGPFGFNNQMRLPDNASYVLQWLVIARDIANGNSRAWRVVAMATRSAGAGSTTVFPPSITDIATSLGATGWRLSLTADTYNGAVQLNGIGAAGRPVQWVAAMIDGENIG